MKIIDYSLEFHVLSEGRSEPINDGETIVITADGGLAQACVPNVGDLVEFEGSADGKGSSFYGRVIARRFVYTRINDSLTRCHIHPDVKKITADEWGKLTEK